MPSLYTSTSLKLGGEGMCQFQLPNSLFIFNVGQSCRLHPPLSPHTSTAAGMLAS